MTYLKNCKKKIQKLQNETINLPWSKEKCACHLKIPLNNHKIISGFKISVTTWDINLNI